MDDEAVAAALGAHLSRLAFADRATDDVTELLIAAVVDWAVASGWRAYRRAASVVPLPPPYERQFSVVDVGIARRGAAPGPPGPLPGHLAPRPVGAKGALAHRGFGPPCAVAFGAGGRLRPGADAPGPGRVVRLNRRGVSG
jgi:hypothetical protein